MPAITKPTLVLDEERVRRNIELMADRARRLGVRFRPHFKTHQSHEAGRLFKEQGVSAITVSSVDMARYFAADGWADILIAFPVNVLEVQEVARLAAELELGVLVESPEAVGALRRGLHAPADLWVKVDVGYGRAGIGWEDADLIAAICRESAAGPLRLKGLLTHNGLTYEARSLGELERVHGQALRRLRKIRASLADNGFPGMQISVGDTPSCRRLDGFTGVDEIRPGNFVLYDAMQLELGTCAEDEIAAAVACPVVAVHPRSSEAVIYGGAVHLSKDCVTTADGRTIFGRVCPAEGTGWGRMLADTAVTRISQEHGIIRTTPGTIARLRAGDILYVLPAHSCLTVNLWSEYRLLDGRRWPTMRASL